jgi:hypothetical protein
VSRTKKKSFKPEVYIDTDSDFASIKIAPGIEARSYIQDGFVFCEDKNGKVIEVQVLNLSQLGKKKTHSAA